MALFGVPHFLFVVLTHRLTSKLSLEVLIGPEAACIQTAQKKRNTPILLKVVWRKKKMEKKSSGLVARMNMESKTT